MLELLDLAGIAIESRQQRDEKPAGRLKVPGLGHVESHFLYFSGWFPLMPIDSVLVVQTSDGMHSVPLVDTVQRSLMLAYIRRWGGALGGFGVLVMLMVVIKDQSMPVEWWLACVAPLLVLAASHWPLGTANLGLARTIATAAKLPTHDIERAYGVITAEQHAQAQARWRASRVQREQEQREAYEGGLRALLIARRQRKNKRKGPSSS